MLYKTGSLLSFSSDFAFNLISSFAARLFITNGAVSRLKLSPTLR